MDIEGHEWEVFEKLITNNVHVVDQLRAIVPPPIVTPIVTPTNPVYV